MADKYDPDEKFSQPHIGMVLVGLTPTDAEYAEVRGRIAAGERPTDVWADIDARIAKRWQERRDAGDTTPTGERGE